MGILCNQHCFVGGKTVFCLYIKEYIYVEEMMVYNPIDVYRFVSKFPSTEQTLKYIHNNGFNSINILSKA